MCNIAGYVGSKNAAHVLIEMTRRQQFIDGGVCTGIATIHEGKLYYAKVVGDVDTLLRETDAANFPGTVGIMHSRPGGDIAAHAHPFVDRSGNLAIVTNGTMGASANEEYLIHEHDIMQDFMDRGFPVLTCSDKGSVKPLSNGLKYHPCEPWALFLGEAAAKYQKEELESGMLDAMAETLDTFPGDRVIVSVNALLDGVITIGRMTRPMFAGLGDGETYIATTEIAYPENAGIRSIVTLPTCSVSQIKAGSLYISDRRLQNIRVESPNAHMFAAAYNYLENLLTGAKDEPKSIYDFELSAVTDPLWSKPYVDCKYSKPGKLLKPSAALMYEVLAAFYREGRLRSVVADRNGVLRTKFWLE